LALAQVRFEIIVVIETWLNEQNEGLYEIEGYSHLPLNRLGRGGGIRLYYLSCLNIEKIDELTSIYGTHESLFVRVSFPKSRNYIIGCVYRPPNGSIVLFNNCIENALLNANIRGNNVIIVGDFNIDLIQQTNNYSVRNYRDIMIAEGFEIDINRPTRCDSRTGLASSLIDHVWCNFARNNETKVIDYIIADHLPIHFCFEIGEEMTMKTSIFRDFSKKSLNAFNAAKTNLFANYEISTLNINTEINRFEIWIENVLNRFFPIKRKIVSYKRIKVPWIDADILQSINKKHKLFLLLKRKYITYTCFKAFSTLLKILIKESKRVYFLERFKRNKGDSKRTWKTINSLLGRNAQEKPLLIQKSDGSEVVDPNLLAGMFNDYFIEIPNVTQAKLGNSINDYDHLVPFNDRTIFLRPATNSEVAKLIKSLENKGGSLKLPIKFLKIAVSELSNIIAELFNISISEGIYPTNLKIAKIVPIYKNGSRKLLSNYRPISLLGLLNKIFEKLLYLRFDSFFDKSELYSDCQYGFRKLRDSQQATLKLIDLLLPNFGTVNCSACVFLDFSKAFDTVDRNILLNKLYKYGIRGKAHDLVTSYLSDRRQYVEVPLGKSGIQNCDIGVPQGSCLGPLFFIMYTNDLYKLLNNIGMVTYADDTVIADHSHNPDVLSFKLNYYMYKLLDWCKYNKLSLNGKKTKWMIFGNKSKHTFPDLYMDNVKIEKVYSFKYLGFHLDNKFNHEVHLKNLVSRLSRFKYVSSRIGNHMTVGSARTFYFSMVQSIFCYGLLVWGGKSTTSIVYKRLCKLQDKIVYNLFASGNDLQSPISLLYYKIGILRLHDLYKLRTCHFIYRIINNNVAPFLLTRVLELIRDHTHDTRSRNTFKLPFPRVKSVKNNFVYVGLKLWNDLSCELKNLTSERAFKSVYKKHLLEKYRQ
jgi:hypothetical protein